MPLCCGFTKKIFLKTKLQVLAITNYRPDQQQSMLRFGDLLLSKKNTHSNFEFQEIFPSPIFRTACPAKRFQKWAAYIDKYILFPKKLKRKFLTQKDPVHLIHITDHSNAIYLPKLSRVTQTRKIITCHDLIAIRTAKGDFTQAPQISESGKRLQSWIADSLSHADYYACDSRQTLEDLNWLIPHSKEYSSILHLGTEKDLSQKLDREDLSKKLPFVHHNTNFLLHVGSSAWYKNRKAVFRSFVHAHKRLPDHDLKLVLVGPEPQKEELDDHLSNWFKTHPNAMYSLQNLTENSLKELYKHAKALIFPSFIEGFGWPPLEAAIHGCRVITTRTGAIADLLGDYAKYVEAENQASIDHSLQELLRLPTAKRNAIDLPSHEDCRKQYLDLYEQMVRN